MSYDSATLIILDIGKNTVLSEDKQESFFETARKCAARIIERNILIQANPLIGVILMGAKKSKNSLAEQCPGAFKYIDVLTELASPTWQMIRDLPSETTERKGDWFETLIVAAHLFKESSFKIKGGKKIVLITNFQSPANIGKNFDEVINGFKEEEFEVFVIGPDLEIEDNANLKHIQQFINETQGETATFEEAMSSWLFHKKKSVRTGGLTYNLFIGPHINIPVAQHIKVKDEPVMKRAWQKTVKDPTTGAASSTEAVVTERKIINTENQTAVPHEETVTGYLFGQKVIPFTQTPAELSKDIRYKLNRTIVLYGFTNKKNIDWQTLNDNCTHYLTGKKGNQRAQAFVKCLVHCMHEMGLVGIIREQFLDRCAPKIKVLMPVIDNSGLVCLSSINVCFKEEIKHMAFPSTDLKKYSCTTEQVNAFKELIKAMDLTNAYDDSFNDAEAFPIGETVSPSLQYVLDCIAYRAMNPGKPLPQPRDEIMTLFKVPPLVEKRSREPLEQLMKLLTLTKVEKKVSNRKKGIQMPMDIDQKPYNGVATSSGINQDTDMPKIKLPIINKDDNIENIGTVNPTKDFRFLLGKGKSLADLAAEMKDVIETLVFTNFVGDYTKVLNIMRSFREECVKDGPAYYNDWIQNFKKVLLERKRDVVVNIINENKLGLILSAENSSSTFTEDNNHEDSQMYDNNTMPNSTELSIQAEVNDLFDEM